MADRYERHEAILALIDETLADYSAATAASSVCKVANDDDGSER